MSIFPSFVTNSIIELIIQNFPQKHGNESMEKCAKVNTINEQKSQLIILPIGIEIKHTNNYSMWRMRF